VEKGVNPQRRQWRPGVSRGAGIGLVVGDLLDLASARSIGEGGGEMSGTERVAPIEEDVA
jgi:hypothetical protein